MNLYGPVERKVSDQRFFWREMTSGEVNRWGRFPDDWRIIETTSGSYRLAVRPTDKFVKLAKRIDAPMMAICEVREIATIVDDGVIWGELGEPRDQMFWTRAENLDS